MSILNRFFHLSIILLLTTFSAADDLALDLAEKFFNSGDYYNAITEYKRFIFFNSNKNNDNLSYVYFKIGLAYRNQKKWQECTNTFQKSIQTAATEEIRDERKIALAIALISNGHYSTAEFLLIKVEMFSRIPKLKQKAAFFRAISSLYSFKWNQARETFHFYSINAKSESQEIFNQVDSLLAEAKDFKYKSPKLAKMLSAILPGSGQIYAGDWGNGVNALLINAATGYLFVNDFLNHQYLDAIFNSLFLFERFYSGNRSNAEKSAKKYNERKNQLFAAKILEILNAK